jgi:AhpD family alkylhydroperoxidase
MMVEITVAQRCEYCLWKHVLEAVKLGANLEDNSEAVSTATLMTD